MNSVVPRGVDLELEVPHALALRAEGDRRAEDQLGALARRATTSRPRSGGRSRWPRRCGRATSRTPGSTGSSTRSSGPRRSSRRCARSRSPRGSVPCSFVPWGMCVLRYLPSTSPLLVDHHRGVEARARRVELVDRRDHQHRQPPRLAAQPRHRLARRRVLGQRRSTSDRGAARSTARGRARRSRSTCAPCCLAASISSTWCSTFAPRAPRAAGPSSCGRSSTLRRHVADTRSPSASARRARPRLTGRPPPASAVTTSSSTLTPLAHCSRRRELARVVADAVVLAGHEDHARRARAAPSPGSRGPRPRRCAGCESPRASARRRHQRPAPSARRHLGRARGLAPGERHLLLARRPAGRTRPARPRRAAQHRVVGVANVHRADHARRAPRSPGPASKRVTPIVARSWSP